MARAVAAIGECMLELSGQSGAIWRMGYAGDTFNTLWAVRALTGSERQVDYVSAFGDDPFSTGQIAFFKEHGIGIASQPGDRWCPARPLCHHADRRRAVLHLLARRRGRAAACARPGRIGEKP